MEADPYGRPTMTTSLSDELLDRLQGDEMRRISEAVGLPVDRTRDAVGTALPLLFDTLARKASRPDGAAELHGMLDRDHRGHNIGNVIGSVLGGNPIGGDVLDRVLGQRTPLAAQAVASRTDLDELQSAHLLRVLAPAVMAFLARRALTAEGADSRDSASSGPLNLQQLLQRESEQLHATDSPHSGLLSTLDRDHDGDVDLSDFVGGGTPLGVQTAEMRSPRPLL